MTNIDIGGYKLWKKFCLVFCALSLLFSPVYAESEIELTVPELEPEAEYVMTGQDIMTLYQTINDLNETKNEWENLTNESMRILNDAKTLCREYEKENKKLTFQNNFLIGTTVCSVGICVAGVITFMCLNTK